MLYGDSGGPSSASYRTSGIPLESVLVGRLETSTVVAQQLIKSTTSVWIGMGPGAGRVDNDWLWPYPPAELVCFGPLMITQAKLPTNNIAVYRR